MKGESTEIKYFIWLDYPNFVCRSTERGTVIEAANFLISIEKREFWRKYTKIKIPYFRVAFGVKEPQRKQIKKNDYNQHNNG